MQDVDGLIMVIDPQRAEQERELETFYRNFAEPNNLYTRQCLVLGIQVQNDGSYGLGGWGGQFLRCRATCRTATKALEAATPRASMSVCLLHAARSKCMAAAAQGLALSRPPCAFLGLLLHAGLKGGLNKLTQQYVGINPANPGPGLQARTGRCSRMHCMFLGKTGSGPLASSQRVGTLSQPTPAACTSRHGLPAIGSVTAI